MLPQAAMNNKNINLSILQNYFMNNVVPNLLKKLLAVWEQDLHVLVFSGVHEFLFQITLLSICVFANTQKMSKIRVKAYEPVKCIMFFLKWLKIGDGV